MLLRITCLIFFIVYFPGPVGILRCHEGPTEIVLHGTHYIGPPQTGQYFYIIKLLNAGLVIDLTNHACRREMNDSDTALQQIASSDNESFRTEIPQDPDPLSRWDK